MGCDENLVAADVVVHVTLKHAEEEEVAQQYLYEITAFKGNVKYSYGGEVSSLRVPDDDIVTQGKCLSINVQIGRHLRDENKIRYKLKLMKVLEPSGTR